MIEPAGRTPTPSPNNFWLNATSSMLERGALSPLSGLKIITRYRFS